MKIKIKIIIASVLALCIGLVTNVQAQDCCGGQPLPAGDECCNDQPINPNDAYCCTSAQESAWQSSYNSCKTTAQNTQTTDDNLAINTYNSFYAGCQYVANEDCSWATGSAYTVCYDTVMAAEADEIGAALLVKNASLA